jgi:CelD/BcsL family acetyltransferase involved in cellulose biosynthesis
MTGPAPPLAFRLEPVPDLDALRDEWPALALASGNPFLTWEWMSTWWGHFGRDRRSLVTACRRSTGELAAVLPVYESATRPLRIVRLMGHGPGDHLGLVCAPGDRRAVAESFKRMLGALSPEWDLFVGEHLPAEEKWSASLGARVIGYEQNPAVTFGPDGWRGYLATRSAHLRKRIRYSEGRLARSARAEYRLTEDPGRLEADLEVLFALHAARWGHRASAALAAPRQAFHREFAALALDRGWLRLWFLDLDERPVAAWYGLRFGGVEWFYQAGRDPAFDQLSVGFVLLLHTMREAAQDGMREYRFLSGDEPYKHRLADDGPGLETVAMARGSAGRAGLLLGPPVLTISRGGHPALARAARRVVRLAG